MISTQNHPAIIGQLKTQNGLERLGNDSPEPSRVLLSGENGQGATIQELLSKIEQLRKVHHSLVSRDRRNQNGQPVFYANDLQQLESFLMRRNQQRQMRELGFSL